MRIRKVEEFDGMLFVKHKTWKFVLNSVEFLVQDKTVSRVGRMLVHIKDNFTKQFLVVNVYI